MSENKKKTYLNDLCDECFEEYKNGFIVQIIIIQTDKKGNTHYGCIHQIE